MSKSGFDYPDTTDRIPTYEEALASPSRHLFASSSPRPSSNTSGFREERTRRISEVAGKTIIPCFASHVSNLCTHVTIILVPADTLPQASTVTEHNIVSPSLQSSKTTGSVAVLTGAENRPNFWTQQSVVQELDRILRKELSGSAPEGAFARPEAADEKPQPSLLPPLRVQPAPDAPLPPRPGKMSWLKRNMSLPGPDHDPTGDTGKWNLGWRSPEPSEAGAAQYSWTSRPRDRSSPLRPDQVAVHTQLQDVTFRIENEMGLLESTTVKCIWIEIEVGV